MPLQFAGKTVLIYGGPYRLRPPTLIGVKLAQEIDAECSIDLPISDYSVPNAIMAKKALLQAIMHIAHGDSLYVGCMGGIGRTGLFLALLAKTSGIDNPIEHVRATYHPDAVETQEQEAFIENFPVFWLRSVYKLSSLVAPKALAPRKPTAHT